MKYTILDAGVVKFRTYYAAVEKVDLKINEREVFAVVILLDYAKDYCNFGYKVMDESCGPNEVSCPERILKLLTPTNKEYAINWRKNCQEAIQNRKNKLQKIWF
jgi:hypothetical protein